MSDWQYGYDNGLWGVDGTPYFLDGEKKESRYVIGKEIENEEAINLAEELVHLKNQIAELKVKEDKVKNKLKDFMPLHSKILLNNNWRVECRLHVTPLTFKRLEVLEYLEETFSNDIAKQVDRECTNKGKRRSSIYVKPPSKLVE